MPKEVPVTTVLTTVPVHMMLCSLEIFTSLEAAEKGLKAFREHKQETHKQCQAAQNAAAAAGRAAHHYRASKKQEALAKGEIPKKKTRRGGRGNGRGPNGWRRKLQKSDAQAASGGCHAASCARQAVPLVNFRLFLQSLFSQSVLAVVRSCHPSSAWSLVMLHVHASLAYTPHTSNPA
jgi:hypothetical protein